ncbi:MAG: HAD family phosphatase [Oscillospiraceae bacterium]|nr:HAD family phosphatase [Oscillospiraceae bacterium]
MRLQSAIFDMDGTLLDSMYIWNDLGPNLLRAGGIEPGPELRDKLRTVTVREGAAYCRETYGLPQTVDEIVAQIEGQVEDFYFHQVQAKPGVQKFLSLLKMEGVWMYVATATDRRLAEAALRHAGISQYFRGMLTCPEVGAGKNHSPEIYERAMRRLRSNKKDTVVFEDALHAIQTAKSAGFRVAAVYDPSAEEDQEEIKRIADYYIRSFDEMFESEVLK